MSRAFGCSDFSLGRTRKTEICKGDLKQRGRIRSTADVAQRTSGLQSCRLYLRSRNTGAHRFDLFTFSSLLALLNVDICVKANTMFLAPCCVAIKRLQRLSARHNTQAQLMCASIKTFVAQAGTPCTRTTINPTLCLQTSEYCNW